MKRKKIISVIAVILVVMMLISLVASAIPMIAFGDELDDLQAKKSELSAQAAECKARLEALQDQQANVLEQRAALQEQNRIAEEQLAVIEEEIEDYNRLIAKKAKEVDAAKNREAIQLDKYRTRIRAMEENGGYNILALVLKAGDFAQLLTAMDDMGEIMQSDKQLQRDYAEAREETEEIKAQYEEEKAGYEAQQKILEQEQEEISKQVESATKLLESLDEEIEKAIQEYEAAEAAESAAAATIAGFIAALAAQKAAENEAAQAEAQQMIEANAEAAANGEEAPYSEEQIQQASTTLGGGYVDSSEGLMWPVPCSTRITSRYGNRSDPFTGATAYHSGIDIDGFNNEGNIIVAAASGTVVTASYDGGYGNYVIVDHGNMQTLYAHMSGMAVSVGDYVAQGQTVGYLGATGRATGTHCHFEVFVGGSRTDPAAYFSGMTYYNC